MRAILATTLLTFSAVAGAQAQYPLPLELQWQNPTLYVDGTDIGPEELRGTAFICSRHSGEEVINEEIPSAGPGTVQSTVFQVSQPGTYTCYAYAITVDDIYSDASNPASKKYTGKPQKVIVEVK
jgi:hypothetical protein